MPQLRVLASFKRAKSALGLALMYQTNEMSETLMSKDRARRNCVVVRRKLDFDRVVLTVGVGLALAMGIPKLLIITTMLIAQP